MAAFQASRNGQVDPPASHVHGEVSVGELVEDSRAAQARL
jgi:hypothetical protein